MTQEQVNSLIRTFMALIGGLLTGGAAHYFFGHVIDTAYWEELTGIILTLASIVWSISTKHVDVEKTQGAVRQVLTFIMAIVTAKGLLSEQQALAIITFVGAIIPYIQAGLSRRKTEQLSTGEVRLAHVDGKPKIVKGTVTT